MKAIMASAAFLFIFGTADAKAQADTTFTHPELRAELLELGERDQRVRQDIMAKQREGIAVTETDVARLDSIDNSTRLHLKSIIEEHGWPTSEMVGADAANSAFLIAQHADKDIEFQKSGLEYLRQSFEEGDASGQHIALLTDRVRVNEGKMQLFGTQASLDGRNIVLHPVEDSMRVDERRADLGLPPLEQYLELLREAYLGAPSENGQ